MNNRRAQHVQIVQRIVGHTAAGALLLFCLVSFLLLVIHQGSRLFLLNEAGYGDSYILYDALQFQNTGVIYRDLSRPPYLPAQYSPLVYMLYSLPGRIAAWENPYLGPRLMALTAFLLCIAMVVSIVPVLIPARFAWLWGLLLAGSIWSMHSWVLQLRGDFPGIFFSLVAIRLLLVRSRWAVLLAGVCAGLATQFKITFVAALAAGSLWLLIRHQWKELAGFAAAGTLASAGIYLLYWAHEPRMISQMLALSPAIMDVRGCLRLMYRAMSEPVVLLALSAIPPVASRAWSRWALLLLFVLTSFAIAGLTDLQAGGNINYFFEGLFAVCPAAVLGVLRLMVWARRRVAVGLFLVGLFVFHFLSPRAQDLYLSSFRFEIGPRAVKSENDGFRMMQNALQDQHIFSTVPRLALLDPAPPLIEPYLLSYLQRLGKFDPQPIHERIRKSEFDVVITAARAKSWRGIAHIGPDLRSAIVASYRPQCVMLGYLLHLPRIRLDNSALVQELNRIGCVPIASDQAAAGPRW